MKITPLTFTMAIVAAVGFSGGSIDTTAPGWLSFSQAEADPYRRSVRRTARRTSRRTARRVSARQNRYRGAPYYGAGAVAGAAVVGALAVGSIVASLPPRCNRVVVNGITYHNCDGAYYAPKGSQYIVVDDPYY